MANFDFNEFYNGSNIQYVAHLKKYTKDEFVKQCNTGNQLTDRQEITVEEVYMKQVRHYVKAPYFVYDYDEIEGGCYSFCSKGERGSFPVWVADVITVKNDDSRN